MTELEVVIEPDGLFPHYYFFGGLEQSTGGIVRQNECLYRSKPLFEEVPS